MSAYRRHVEKEATLPTGEIRPWGKTRLDQQTSIRGYLENEAIAKQDFTVLDLGELKLSQCDHIYGVFRGRPLTIRSRFRTRLTPSSASNLIKELGNFFDWLDGTDDFNWYIPRRFHSIKKKPEPLTGTEKYARRLAKKASVIPDDHLITLYETAIPEERLLLLLGMNCAFGAAEVGQLRTTFLDLEKGEIEGIRFKSGGETRHKLWRATREGLTWWMEERKSVSITDPNYQDIVFLTKRGSPLWKYAQRGNSSDGVSNRWYRLIDRVQKDHEDFPRYSFNKLRKTSATRILQIASAEVASMILAHKTISDDELLHHYVTLPWQKLFAAQQELEGQLSTLFEAGGPTPWAPVSRTYIGVGKSKRIIEQFEQGVSKAKIASELSISIATVYRHVAAAVGARKTGRRPKKTA